MRSRNAVGLAVAVSSLGSVAWVVAAAVAQPTLTPTAPGQEDLLQKVLVAVAGGAVGFMLKWLLVERTEWHELRRSIAQARADAYRALWPLCRSESAHLERARRASDLRVWYEGGGGLYLSLAAAQRYLDAVTLLEQPGELSPADLDLLREQLTWLRTEMKRHVGTYSRKDAETQLARTVPIRLAGAGQR